MMMTNKGPATGNHFVVAAAFCAASDSWLATELSDLWLVDGSAVNLCGTIKK
jgi:hypothetical protein